MAENETQGEWALADGWAWTTLGEIADLVGGGTPSRRVPEYFNGDIVWLTPTQIPKDRITVISDSQERITEEGLRKSSARLLPPGTVLMTSRASIGYVAVAGTEVTTNQGFASFVCKERVYNFYLAYWLWGNADAFVQRATGTTFKEISKSKLRPFEFLLPPLPEQHRIVAEIETQFTRLDAGVAALERAQANLRRYKASVLKAACEGRLVHTEASLARAESRDYEPAGQLLARILAERRARWEAEHPGKRYKEPAPPDTESLPALPEGWAWATVEQSAAHEPRSITDGPFGSNLKTAHYTESGPRVIRLQNVGNGEFHDEKAHISQDHFETLRKHEIFTGDLIIAALGKSLPRACIIPAYVGPAIVKADCIRFKPHPSLGVAQYLNAALNSETLKRIAASIVHGVGRPRLNQKEVKSLPVPLPSFAEQRRIAEEVERRLSVVAALEASVSAALARARRLRQAVLKQAFEGRLVEQHPDDEPASVLLERIRAQREARTPARGKQKEKQMRLPIV